MDKLKYIKLENEDGSYSSSIPLAVDGDHVDIKGSTLTNTLSTLATKIDINNLKNEINSLASGSPKGVYTDAGALKTANPETGVYIATSNGHIYSWTKNQSGDPIDLGVYQAASIEDEIEDIQDEIELKGTYYQKSGYYANGVHNDGAWHLSKHFDVENFNKVKVNVVTSQYYDIYDFINAEGTSIEYLRENSSSKTYINELDVPDGAKFLVISGLSTNLLQSTIIGIRSNVKKCSMFNISPINTKNGLWHLNEGYKDGYDDFKFSIFDVSLFDFIDIFSNAVEHTRPYVCLDENFDRVSDKEPFRSDILYTGGDYELSMSVKNVKYIGVTYLKNKSVEVKAYGTNTDKKLYEDMLKTNLRNKKIVWFGTSIPAAGKSGKGNANSYPMRIGKILNANVINEAIGSSAITCKSPDRVSASNPYGFTHDFEGASRCLTNTIEEMNWIIDHYNDSNVFDYRTVQSLSNDDKEFIRSCSYENKLLPYLQAGNEPELFVFDHGHNDHTNDEKESYYDEQIELAGTEESGWYSAGVKQTSSVNLSKRYDVSDYSQIVINAEIAAWYDVYDLFDSNGNYLRSMKNNSGTTRSINHLEIDVSDAASIVVSSSNPLLSTFEVKAYKYDRENNLYCYQGAMRFLLSKILSYNPKARIVMIGEYENEKQPYIAKYQEKVAEKWNLPIYKQWDMYGWSSNEIKTKWYWDNGVWTLGDEEHTMTILNCWLADTVHPHSDTSGKTLEFMAEHIGHWLQDNIWLMK